MIEQFIAYIREHDLFRSGTRILVAVSGGIDSVVLVDLLAQLAPEWRLELYAAHYNHQLRGADSDGDEAFVHALCAERAIPCETGRGEVRAWARQHRLSLETAGRTLRYAFLQETARRRGCTVIATGHHAGDQAETVLDRLIRGAGARGLAGIAPRSPAASAREPADAAASEPEPLWLIRPLLFASRTAITVWAEARGLTWREDASNRDRRIRRNRIRHELLPLLQTYNPRIESALCRTADHLRETEAFLCSAAREALDRCRVEESWGKIVIEKEPFLSYFIILQKYALQEAWRRISGGTGDLDAAFWKGWHRFIAAGRTDRAFSVGGAELWQTEHRLVLLSAQRGGHG
ncbi:MAG TPA: tRNA lysidine(34) synthetase TilS, partial [bacterium]|nr:tRNA lysidine(34) synthetase TilS [bacterium]